MSKGEVPGKYRLPIVSQETVEAFYAEGKANPIDYGRRLEEFKAKLIAENPQLCRHISAELSKYPSELHALIFGTMVSALLMVERQGMANLLNTSIINTEGPTTNSS